MSYTEIYGLPKNFSQGDCIGYEAHNAWLGAAMIWKKIGKEYIDPNFNIMDSESFELLLLLQCDKRVECFKRVMLLSTCDYALVRRTEIPKLIECYKQFMRKYETEGNLREQINILNLLYRTEGVEYVGWNQSSIGENPWEEYEESEAKHFFIFDKVEEVNNDSQ